MVNTIVDGNTVGNGQTGPDIATTLSYGPIWPASPIVANYSLIGTTTGYSIGSGTNDVTGLASNVNALAGNGGPTSTQSLPVGSPAIGTGGAVTTVGTAFPAAGNSITVTNGAVFGTAAASPLVIVINSEEMLVTAVAGNTLTVVRGYNGTTPAAALAGANVFFAYDQRGYAMTPVTLATPDMGAYQTTGTAPGTPTVTGVSPASGPVAGGTSVTITGTNLQNATAVYFGGLPGTIVSDSGTTVVAIDPAAAAAGTVDITVTTVGWDTSATSPADQFSYAGAVYGDNLAAGVLSITQLVPTANDNLTFSLSGGNYTITDTGGLAFATPTGSGAASITGGLTNSITIPSASVTSISFVLGTGTNVFTFLGTNGAAAAPITVNDGTTAGDQVVISAPVLDSGAVSLTANSIIESGTGTLNAGANTVNLTATTTITQAAAGLITAGAGHHRRQRRLCRPIPGPQCCVADVHYRCQQRPTVVRRYRHGLDPQRRRDERRHRRHLVLERHFQGSGRQRHRGCQYAVRHQPRDFRPEWQQPNPQRPERHRDCHR